MKNPLVCCRYVNGIERYDRVRLQACELVGIPVSDSYCRTGSSGHGGGGSGLQGWLNDMCSQVPCYVREVEEDGRSQPNSLNDVDGAYDVLYSVTVVRKTATNP